MAFYSQDPAMGQLLENVVRALELEGRPGLSQRLSITWLRYEAPLGAAAAAQAAEPQLSAPPLAVAGAAWAGAVPRYPASVVKLVYLAAVEAWLQRRLLEDTPELRRALAAMVRESSNDATSLVVDLLSGTTSGPALPPHRFAAWAAQRQLVNEWLAELAWPELAGANACQKTWTDAPYGREREFYGPGLQNRNRLNSDAVARLLHSILAGELLSPPACARMRGLLERPLEDSDQVQGFLGGGLPPGSRLWSKAGWMSEARHDAAYVEAEGCDPFLLVVMAEGASCAADAEMLPFICGRLLQNCRRRMGN
jgi:hypothetical protein